MVVKRDKLEIVQEILQKSIGGATKTYIVYKVNLNFRTVNPYLDLLTSRGLLEVSSGSSKIYKTTEKGISLLRDLEKVRDGMESIKKSDDIPP